MVLTFKKGEDINSVILVDITEEKNQTENCNLELKKEVYKIVVTNGKESLKFKHAVK